LYLFHWFCLHADMWSWYLCVSVVGAAPMSRTRLLANAVSGSFALLSLTHEFRRTAKWARRMAASWVFLSLLFTFSFGIGCRSFSIGIVLVGYSDLMNRHQLLAGGMVLLREVGYFLLTLVALFHKPAYLLYDPRLAWDSEGGRCRSEVWYYTLMPEKWLIDVVASDYFRNFHRGNRISSFCQMLTTVPDLFSVYALAPLLLYGEIWWALIFGYSVTAAGLFLFLYFKWRTCKHFLIAILCCIYLMTDKFPWEWKYTWIRGLMQSCTMI